MLRRRLEPLRMARHSPVLYGKFLLAAHEPKSSTTGNTHATRRKKTAPAVRQIYEQRFVGRARFIEVDDGCFVLGPATVCRN
jgi:hypothetical protein